jgi:leucine dehydrogenase
MLKGSKDMETLIQSWEGESVISRFDRESGTWMFIAIHSTALGVATGGTRLKPYPTPRDALFDAMRLAEGMTYKWAGVEFPRGGGKAVLDIPDSFDPSQREGLMSHYGRWLADLNGIFETGPDLGTTPSDMALIRRWFDGVFGCPTDLGGAGNPGPYTALGVFSGIRASCEQRFNSSDMSGRSVLVQGVGSVGEPLVHLLLEAGCDVKFSDLDSARIDKVRQELGLSFVEPEAIYGEPCDVFAPCATGGILNAKTIPQLKCSIVAGGANNQLERSQDGVALHQQDILYAPDYIINAGGAIYLVAVESMGWNVSKARDRIVEIGDTLKNIYAHAEKRGISTMEAAAELAKHRVKEATLKKRTES